MKKIVFLPLILALLLIPILSGCGKNNARLQNAFSSFSNALEQQPADQFTLKIFYISPSILTRAPLTVDDLIHHSAAQQIIVHGESLKDHVDLLKQLNADNFVLAKHTSSLNARICCIFETENDGQILEMAIGGDNGCIFVNGVEVEYSNHFYDVIQPFLSEGEIDELHDYFKGRY